MQAIRTTHFGTTSDQGSRMAAQCSAGMVAIPYDYELSTMDNHRLACEALLKKLGWTTSYCPGSHGFYVYWVPLCDSNDMARP